MARTSRIDDLAFFSKSKVLAGRSFDSIFGSAFKPAVNAEVMGATGQAHPIPAPTALQSFTDISAGEPTQAPDIQDITLVSKKTTRAGVPEVRVCASLNDNALLAVYSPQSAEIGSAAPGVRTSSGAGSLRGSGGAGVRTSGGAGSLRGSGGARGSGDGAAQGGVRTSGSDSGARQGAGADGTPLPFTPFDLIVGLPQRTMWHPLEARVKPVIPVLHTAGVPAEW
jgi:hypothetical protein